MNALKFILWVCIGVAGVFFVIIPGCLYAIMFLLETKVRNEPERRVSLNVPYTSATLSVFTQHNHPFFAEYKRRITLDKPGEKTISKTIDDDTGGRNILDLYAMPQDNSMRLLLVDGWLGSTTDSMHTLLHDPELGHESRIYLNTTVTAQADTGSTGVFKLGRFDAKEMVWEPNR